jgi:lysophospholipase L1-like esterase
MRTRFPTSGLTTGGPNYVASSYGAAYTYGTMPSWSGAGSTNSLVGLGVRSTVLSASQSRTITFTGTGFELCITKWSGGGTLSYTVDGGSAVTSSTTAASFTTGQRVPVTGLSLGSHTVVVSNSAGGNVYIEGIVIYNGDETKGIRSFDSGHSGFKTSDFESQTYNNLSAVVTCNPHLVTIGLGDNDWSTGVSPATAAANIQSIITQIRAGLSVSPSFVIILWSRPLAANFTPSGGATWQQFADAYYAIAAADPGVVVFDVGLRTIPASSSNALGLWNADLQHPSDKGHGWVADALASFISPK